MLQFRASAARANAEPDKESPLCATFFGSLLFFEPADLMPLETSLISADPHGAEIVREAEFQGWCSGSAQRIARRLGSASGCAAWRWRSLPIPPLPAGLASPPGGLSLTASAATAPPHAIRLHCFVADTRRFDAVEAGLIIADPYGA